MFQQIAEFFKSFDFQGILSKMDVKTLRPAPDDYGLAFAANDFSVFSRETFAYTYNFPGLRRAVNAAGVFLFSALVFV